MGAGTSGYLDNHKIVENARANRLGGGECHRVRRADVHPAMVVDAQILHESMTVCGARVQSCMVTRTININTCTNMDHFPSLHSSGML